MVVAGARAQLALGCLLAGLRAGPTLYGRLYSSAVHDACHATVDGSMAAWPSPWLSMAAHRTVVRSSLIPHVPHSLMVGQLIQL